MKIRGAPRKVTDLDVYKLRAWRPFKDLCADLGISRDRGYHIRGGYQFKKPCPEKLK
jgi:hypothetical protein